MKERRYDIDWLRVIAMLAVFLVHCSRFFCTEDWHLKVPGPEQSDILRIVREVVISVWFMELFFLVSGFATYYSLRRRSAGQYLLERVKRLLVPLYTVGLFILVVPQKYFHGVTNGYIMGTFWEWLPSYYRTLPASLVSSWHPLRSPDALLPYTFSGHLWFIQWLFVISLVTLPLLLFLRSERGGRFIDRLAGRVARPGGIFLFLIPIVLAEILFYYQPETPGRGWPDFILWALFFVIGYLIAADGRFTEGIKRHGWLCLGLWLGFYAVVGGVLSLVFHYDAFPAGGFSMPYVIYVLTWGIISGIIQWSAVVFLLSLGAKYLTFSNRLLTYSNEAVLPFYLLHQTIILIVGWFVLPWDISNVAKFFIIALVSFPTILLLYELFIRHIGFMRFLFGMAPQKKQPTLEKEEPTWKSRSQSPAQ